jgi:hypothetical protein
MKGYLTLYGERLGEIDFKVIDESMGGIGGRLVPFPAYSKFRDIIQSLYDSKGVANIDDFEFSIILQGDISIIPEGGIAVTDSRECDEIYVDSAGVHPDIISMIRGD